MKDWWTLNYLGMYLSVLTSSVYECMSCSCCSSGMIAYGCRGLLLLMQTETEECTMPTQVNKKARLHTRLVCRNRGTRWHDLLAQCFGIGGAKYVSFLCIWACAKRCGVAKPQIVRGAFLFFACVGATSDAMQSWQRMRVMARLCKRARARLGGAKWRNVFLLKCIATAWRRAQDSLWHV